ncbi:uncharacterized protein LOC130674515 isoform X2 [Microplitis mediator]|uniref:uncharacterized protein LOC130674515 isoform X2 n=1 Tax=Microplitis mediator TaxID=375433 RepID=UPI002556A894|nr:uncharacterized protein LOC130674515 isoform X2 [Microplitis mediator]
MAIPRGATFQRLMDLVLRGLQGADLFVYLDDIVIYARSLEEHNTKFNKLAERLRSANLTLQADKCEFLKKEVIYLGHLISADGVKPDPDKIKAIKCFKTPGSTTQVREFLGLAGYYRRFIKDFAKISKCLSDLTSKNARFTWTPEHQVAFETLRDKLCTAPILQYPDFSKPFILTTDASNYAVGAILSQGKIGEDTIVATASRVLNKHENNYSTTEKEMVAALFGMKTFRPYLYGREFTLVTDHRPLVWVNNMNDPTSRVMRWRERLKEFEYTVLYKAGKINTNADALSRNPIIENRETYPIKIKWRPGKPGIARLRTSDPSDDGKVIKKKSKYHKNSESSSSNEKLKSKNINKNKLSSEENTINDKIICDKNKIATNSVDRVRKINSKIQILEQNTQAVDLQDSVEKRKILEQNTQAVDLQDSVEKRKILESKTQAFGPRNPVVKPTSDSNRISYPNDRRLGKNNKNGYIGKNKNLKKKRSDVRRYNPYEKFSSTESLSEVDYSKNKNNKINTNNPQELKSNLMNKNNQNKSKLDSNENSNSINKSNEKTKINKDSKSNSNVLSNPESNKPINLPDYSDVSSSSGDIYDAVALRKKLMKYNPSCLSDDSYLTDFGLSYINSPKRKNSRNLTPSPQSLNPQTPKSYKNTNTPLSLSPNVRTQNTSTHSDLNIQTDKRNTKIDKNKPIPSQIKRTTKMAEFTPSPAIRTRRKVNKQSKKIDKIITPETSDDESNTDETEMTDSKIYSEHSNDISTESPIETIPITPRTPIKPKSVNNKDMGGAIPWSSDEGGDHARIMDVSALIHNEPENKINMSTNDIIEKSFTTEPMIIESPDETTTTENNTLTHKKIVNKNTVKTQTNTTKTNPNLNNTDKNRPHGTDTEQTHTNKITPELRRSTRKRKIKTCSCCTDYDEHTHSHKQIPNKIQHLANNFKNKTRKSTSKNSQPKLPDIMINNGKMDSAIYFLIMGQLIISALPANGFIAYDCGAPAMNITTLSLLNIKDCDIPISQPAKTDTKIQLLQLVEMSHIQVIQCKIILNRAIYNCGHWSHVSTVANGHMEYVQEISREACKGILETKTYRTYETTIKDIFLNSTTTQPITLAGNVDLKGNCEAGKFADHYGSWTNVVVHGRISITIQDYLAPVNLQKNEVLLRSGVKCAYSTGSCMDTEGGNTYWNLLETDQCKFNRFKVLYEGPAEKIKDISIPKFGQEIYSVTANQITFALSVKGFIPVCGYKIIKTEHPKLFIVDSEDKHFFLRRTTLSTENMDIFAYVNTKIVYLEHHLRKEITALYNDVMQQQCELEKLILHNTLALASVNPAEFAFHFMKQPGYIAHLAGEVIRLAKCVPIEVKNRKTTECFQELPVIRGEQEYFMLPKTHVLVKTGNQIDCNSLIPPLYNINNAWYQLLPQISPATAPEEIATRTKMSWKYTSPANLATGGIYSDDDLDRLRENMMFPIEKPAILNTIARGAIGQEINSQGISLSKLIDTSEIMEKLQNTWGKVYNFFNIIGSFSTTLLGIWITGKAFKFIIDTVMHALALHSAFGWSLWLLGAIWDSLTNFLLHRNYAHSAKTTDEKTDHTELQVLIDNGKQEEKLEKITQKVDLPTIDENKKNKIEPNDTRSTSEIKIFS